MLIIGCGNMGKAMAERLSKGHQLFLYDHNIEKALQLEREGYGKACRNLKEGICASELVIFAVKPQNLEEVAALVKEDLRKDQVVVSLLAGVSLEILQKCFATANIVRMMPNLAVIYGEGVIGLTSTQGIDERLTKTFEPLGKVYWLAEEKMNALTALTGSGPAFFYVMIEAMIEAGIAMGFPAKDAQELIHQMLQGSLTLLEKSAKHPGELRWQIASPQGTTIAGLKKLEECALRGGIINTFLAAYERSCELSSICVRSQC